MNTSVSKVSKELQNWAIGHRRYLHQHPELSGQEYETCKYIKHQLVEMNIDILNFQPPNLVGYLKGTDGKKTIALRADIDALPIMEEGDKPYISKVPNVAHACGHDGHTSILLAVAKWMSEHRDQVKHNIVFLFQSSEEMSPSGAEKLVKEGALEQVDAVFGLHLMSSQPKGTIGVCHGPMMASSDDFEITVTGKGGHGSAPHETVDPTYVAGHILTSLQSIVSRRINPIEPTVISVGQLKAGTSYNIIPNEVGITGTFRTFSEANRQFIIEELTRLVERMSASFGASGEVKIIAGTPPVVNDPHLSAYMENMVREVYGEDVLLMIDPVMGSEDFSFYQQEKPGGYIIVGMGGEKSAYPHHHPKFDIDEEEIATAIDLFLNIVEHFE